mgnify:FL=1
MKTSIRLFLSFASFLGILLVSNAINDVETSFLSVITIVALYQVLLAAVLGGLAYVIAMMMGIELIKEESQQQEPTSKVLGNEEDFEIKDISFDHAKVIGHFGGKEIYDSAKVKFANGIEKIYTFADTVKLDSPEKFNLSAMAPGSLIVEPGIVYVPNK